jgi:nucleotide-binding universal stress UspA family protein
MYRRILVPLDGSELAERALKHAETVIGENPTATLVLVRVTEPLLPASYILTGGADVWMDVEKRGMKEATDYLAKVAARLKDEGITKVKTVVLEGQPDDQILNYLEHRRVDLVVMSTHGQSGLSRWLAGSVTERVMRHSRVPVLTVPPPGSRRQRKLARPATAKPEVRTVGKK